MRSELVEPGRAACTVTGWPNVPPRDVRALELSIQTLLRLAGRDEVRVEGRSTADGARFDVAWKI
jgi:hypothetical protein